MTGEVKVKTQAQLLAEMKAATDKGDWKAVSKISSEIARVVASQEKAERDAKLALIAQLTTKVKGTIDKVVNRLVDSKELDGCDGVWYSYDFGEKLTICRLLKSTPRAKGTGGGGKKFSITTKELLEKYGSEVMDVNSGETYQQIWDASTEGNSRYNVRVKLLKLANIG